jgi:DNA invertase Pin-like site-specific DNA recombinase
MASDVEYMCMRAAMYLRVSTDKQKTDMQVSEVRRYVRAMGWHGVEYVEKESSVKHRPVFELLMDHAKQRRFEVVVVWKLDRIARSTKQFVDLVLDLDRAGVRFLSVTQRNIDSDQRDPMGRFLLHLFAALAELERGVIVERVRAGVAEAKRQGKHCGRPRKVFRRDEAAQLRASGMSWRAIARKLGVSFMTVKRSVTKA